MKLYFYLIYFSIVHYDKVMGRFLLRNLLTQGLKYHLAVINKHTPNVS